MDKNDIIKNIKPDMLIIIETVKNSNNDLYLKQLQKDNLYELAENEEVFNKEDLNIHVKYYDNYNYYYFNIIDNDDAGRIKDDIARLPNDYMTSVHLFEIA